MLYMNDMSYNNITHTATDISSITAKKDSCDNIEWSHRYMFTALVLPYTYISFKWINQCVFSWGEIRDCQLPQIFFPFLFLKLKMKLHSKQT